MTEIISKIIIRNCYISSLPILENAEFGYATDVNRVFIGNGEYDIGIGTGTKSIFNLPEVAMPGTSLENPKFFVNGQERSDVVLGDSTVTFSASPASGNTITMKFNSELVTSSSIAKPSILTLNTGNQTYEKTGFFFDFTKYDVAFVDYSVRLTNGTGFNAGSLRIVVNSNTQTFKVDDQYNQISSDVDIFYGGLIEGNIFHLTYLNETASVATFKYVYKLWKM